jgi:aspartokinase/homoserine dehydrogenase 1
MSTSPDKIIDVVKFGGTSVRYGIEHIPSAIRTDNSDTRTIIAVSALSQVTNMLMAPDGVDLDFIKELHYSFVKEPTSRECIDNIIDMCREYITHDTPYYMDQRASCGELLSLCVVSEFLNSCGIPHTAIPSHLFIQTDSTFTDARVDMVATQKLINQFLINSQEKIILTTGFLGSSSDGHLTTLGRGGSDYTATLIGSMVGAREVRIYSDVDGVMTGDPRKIISATLLKTITPREATELSFWGAKILHPKTIYPLLFSDIPLKILNTFNQECEGTLIHKGSLENKAERSGGCPFIAVSSISNISLVTVEGSGVLGCVGLAGQIFSAVAELKISIPFITQASSDTSICFAVDTDDSHKLLNKFDDITMTDYNVSVGDRMSLVTVVGSSMLHRPGVAGKIFTLIGDNAINIVAISQGSSEISITMVVATNDEHKTINLLHTLLEKS